METSRYFIESFSYKRRCSTYLKYQKHNKFMSKNETMHDKDKKKIGDGKNRPIQKPTLVHLINYQSMRNLPSRTAIDIFVSTKVIHE